MKQDIDTEHFQAWPFRAEEHRPDGEINNGGIDLVNNPEKIEIIHEATEENGLRPLLVHLNRPGGCFMTLGCSYGRLDDGLFYSYLEFTIRDAGLAMSADWPQKFEQKWLRYLDRAESQFAGIKRLLEENCKMEWRYFHLRPETAQRLLVTLYPRSASDADHQSLASHIQRFFELLESGELD